MLYVFFSHSFLEATRSDKCLISSAPRHGVAKSGVPIDRIVWQRVDARDTRRLEEAGARLHPGFRRNRRDHLRDK